MAGRPPNKLSARDLTALNSKSGPVSIRYPPGGGRAQVRVSKARPKGRP